MSRRPNNARRKVIPISTFFCPDCNNSVPLPRIKNQREKDHIKDIWCPYCGKIQKMTEQRYFDFDREPHEQ